MRTSLSAIWRLRRFIILEVLGIIALTVAPRMEAAEPPLIVLSGQDATYSTPGTATHAQLRPGVAVAAGSVMKSGASGHASFSWNDRMRMDLGRSSELVLREVLPPRSRMPTAGFAPVDSAIKATLTYNDSRLAPTGLQPASALMELRSGSLIAFVEDSELRVMLRDALLTSRSAWFMITIDGECVRLSVTTGTATLAPKGLRAVEVTTGQFVKLCHSAAGLQFSAPAPIDTDPAAVSDFVAVRSASSGYLAPVGSFKDFKDGKAMPVGEFFRGPADSVGAGPSFPFDLAEIIRPARRREALNVPPNPPNIIPPVTSPEQP